jgi:protein-S-isoprenylcysteine O-methyltransferase Ste14
MTEDTLQRRPAIWVAVPPPVWALLFLLIGWGVGAALGLPAHYRSYVLGAALAVAGFGLALWGRLTFARAGAEIRPASPVNSALVTTGPFRFTRNPMYLGLLILMIALSLLIGTLAVLVADVVFLLWVNFVSIPFEEEKMGRQFGEDYRAYKRRVRRWL